MHPPILDFFSLFFFLTQMVVGCSANPEAHLCGTKVQVFGLCKSGKL